MLTVKASLFHLQYIILSEACCGKNAKAAENCRIFQFCEDCTSKLDKPCISILKEMEGTIFFGVPVFR
jgi:hypothetical protein